jgi:hypothetical protein
MRSTLTHPPAQAFTIVEMTTGEIRKPTGHIGTTPPPHRVANPGGVFDLSALEPEILHRIYTHLVRLQVDARPFHLSHRQDLIHPSWFTGSVIPITPTEPYTCPCVVPGVTNEHGRLQV